MLDYDIVPYEKKHVRTGFDCGIPALNQYLSRRASQDMRKNYAALFVAVQDNTDKILGYYTLSNASVLLDDFSESERRILPKYRDVPAIRLGRLAVDISARGKGVGVKMLGNAFVRCTSNISAWAVMVVDAKDSRARSFYQKYGFLSLADDELRLYAMRKDLEISLDFVRQWT
jgi:predicted GNAT family N-acyltransferase